MEVFEKPFHAKRKRNRALEKKIQAKECRITKSKWTLIELLSYKVLKTSTIPKRTPINANLSLSCTVVCPQTYI